MNTAIGSQPAPTHIPATQTGLKPCQRSCKGLMLYFPPSPTAGSGPHSWRSNEPVCLGLSALRRGPNLDLAKLHEAREVPVGQQVDFSFVLGHAVYQTASSSNNSGIQMLPPGCMTGLEFLRFCKVSVVGPNVAAAAPSAGPEESHGSASGACSRGTSMAQPSSLLSAVAAVSGSLTTFMSGFRILTSDADTNAKLSKTWARIVGFDPKQYATKFESQAQKNLDSMSKWLRSLQEAVSKPKA